MDKIIAIEQGAFGEKSMAVIELVRMIDTVEPPLRPVLLGILEEMDRQHRENVTKKEFNELKEVVSQIGYFVSDLAKAQRETTSSIKELIEAQKRTEQRVEELIEAQKRTEQRVEELIEAQKRTEQRVDHLDQVVAELAEAQKRTEQRVEELIEAQKRTEQRVDHLDQVVAELAEAQKRTEQRVEELIEAQKRTEQRVDHLDQVVAELAEAQKRTEQRVEELIEAQKRTEQRVDHLDQVVAELIEAQESTKQSIKELTEAQKQTEQAIKELTKARKQTEKEIAKIYQQLGGLSMAVGYGIEDRLMPYMDIYAQKTFGLTVSSVDRTNIEYGNGKYDELNMLAKATDKEGKDAYIVAECKAQPGKKDLDRFVALLKRVATKLGENIVPLFIGYSFTPEVEHYAALRYPHVKLVKTYQIEMIGRKHNLT